MRHIMTTAAALLLAACGAGEPAEQHESAPQSQDSTAFDSLTDTLERAEGVEDTLREAAAERRRQLEEQE
jgi:uncharacterized lipoprotein YmbA